MCQCYDSSRVVWHDSFTSHLYHITHDVFMTHSFGYDVVQSNVSVLRQHQGRTPPLIHHSFIWHKSWRIHDSFIRIWYDVAQSYGQCYDSSRVVRHDSFIWQKSRRIHTWHDSFIRIWRGSVMCVRVKTAAGSYATTLSFIVVCHHSFIHRTPPLCQSYDIRHDAFLGDMTHSFGYDVAQSCVRVMVAVGWYNTTHSYVWHGTWLTHMWHDTCASIRMWRGSLMSVWVITAAGSGDVTYSYMRQDSIMFVTRRIHSCDWTNSYVRQD